MSFRDNLERYGLTPTLNVQFGLSLITLMAVRPGKLREALWVEFDFGKKQVRLFGKKFPDYILKKAPMLKGGKDEALKIGRMYSPDVPKSIK